MQQKCCFRTCLQFSKLFERIFLKFCLPQFMLAKKKLSKLLYQTQHQPCCGPKRTFRRSQFTPVAVIRRGQPWFCSIDLPFLFFRHFSTNGIRFCPDFKTILNHLLTNLGKSLSYVYLPAFCQVSLVFKHIPS